jgi:UDP-N-acetylglucosamine--N-acetylmuramyl-(pentapeptide) pyrophosphoryl-undecaprenol N-acetylglucosamine transferase
MIFKTIKSFGSIYNQSSQSARNIFGLPSQTTPEQSGMPKTIFLMGGRTGGPLLPVLAVAKGLEDYVPIVIGVRNSFEEKYCRQTNMPFEALPEAKLTLLSFSNLSFREKLVEILKTGWMLLKLFLSFIYCCQLISKYKPSAVITAGSFLAVPMTYAALFMNLMVITRTKVIVHQQDVQPSLSNKLILRFASLITYVFDETLPLLSPSLKGNKKLPIKIYNPIDYTRFRPDYINNSIIDPAMEHMFRESRASRVSSKPIALIFGGGSGAKAINSWVHKNLEELLKYFSVIHLTGAMQDNEFAIANKPGYLTYEMLTAAMPYALYHSSFVIARAGLATITELQYLSKPAFLVPLPDSHQEANAKSVAKLFPTLNQSNQTTWLATILNTYPQYFESLAANGEGGSSSFDQAQRDIESSLFSYIERVKETIC